MDTQVLFIPQGNDVVVEVHYGPEITDNTGMSAELYYKDNRFMADDDPSTQVFNSGVVADPSVPGQFMSSYSIPSAQNVVTGAFWYRADVIDAEGNRRTAGAGTLLVEAV